MLSSAQCGNLVVFREQLLNLAKTPITARVVEDKIMPAFRLAIEAGHLDLVKMTSWLRIYVSKPKIYIRLYLYAKHLEKEDIAKFLYQRFNLSVHLDNYWNKARYAQGEAAKRESCELQAKIRKGPRIKFLRPSRDEEDVWKIWLIENNWTILLETLEKQQTVEFDILMNWGRIVEKSQPKLLPLIMSLLQTRVGLTLTPEHWLLVRPYKGFYYAIGGE